MESILIGSKQAIILLEKKDNCGIMTNMSNAKREKIHTQILIILSGM